MPKNSVPENTVSENTVPDLVAALRDVLDGEVRSDDYTRHLFSRDASMYSIMPAAVVYPRHAGDVAATARLAGLRSSPASAIFCSISTPL